MKIKCLKCGSIITSESRHDFQQCECKSCFIDGGGDPYIRIGGNPEDMVEIKDDGTEIPISFGSKKEKEENHQISIDEYLENKEEKK